MHTGWECACWLGVCAARRQPLPLLAPLSLMPNSTLSQPSPCTPTPCACCSGCQPPLTPRCAPVPPPHPFLQWCAPMAPPLLRGSCPPGRPPSLRPAWCPSPSPPSRSPCCWCVRAKNNWRLPQRLFAEGLAARCMRASPALTLPHHPLTRPRVPTPQVFRTNSAYARWETGRIAVGRFLSAVKDVCRQAVSAIPSEKSPNKELIARWCVALSRCFKA